MSDDPFAGIPRTLKGGRFELIEPIGTGGAAEVWRARDTERGLDVAIKVLDPSSGHRQDLATRVLAEAKAMHGLRNPRVVRVLDIGRDEGWYWFAMDLCPGGTLRERLVKGPMPVTEALLRVFQILEGLDAAHRSGMVHRDVKPGNILIDARGDAVLADFGVAKIQPADVPHRTERGAFFGSFGYAAPEQRRDARAATPASDVYAVGAVLYAAITGRNPADLTLLATTDRVLEGVPVPVQGVLKIACAADPTARYAEARAMAVAIAEARDAVAGDRDGTAWLAEFDRLRLGESRSGCLRWFLPREP